MVRVCVVLTNEEWYKLRIKGIKDHKFEKNYMTLSLRDAIRMWYCNDYTHPDKDVLLKIAEKKHPNFDERELVKSIFEEAKSLYLKKNKNYL